ncbi:response regulator [Candidatus Leptofilum sp.]|uniref:response regulator n=1 Tax=Candidatus Leptofilum sp. TaxID=3241576 RepID=UPI003B59F9B6
MKRVTRILIVDDHPNAAFILAQVLRGLGSHVEVLTAHNGEEALALVENQPVQVVITDFLMPGMNGLELIEQLQKKSSSSPEQTILITAYDTEGLAATARHLQVDEYLTKPVDPEKVRALVNETLHGAPETPIVHPAEPTKEKFKILVADDDSDHLRLMSTRLADEGYTYFTADDGLEALEKAWELVPDLILLDVNMPGKTGFEVLKEIRANSRTKHIQVLMVTAVRTQPHHIQAGLNLGADDYIVKPIDWHELSARIRTKLRVKRAEDTLRQRNRELALLPEIAQDLSARLDLAELAKIVLERTALAMNGANSHLAIFQPDGSVFQRLFANGELVSLGEDAQKRLVEDGLISHVTTSRQGVVIMDTENDPRWLKTDNGSTRSAIAVPLLGRHDVIGVLTLTHTQPNQFTADHQVLLQAIGSQAAIAAENAQLYMAVEQERKRLEAVLHGVEDAILVTDGRNHLQLANPAAERLFVRDRLRLNQPLPATDSSDKLMTLSQQAQTTGTLQQTELAWPGNRTFQTQVTSVVEGGSVIVLHDITHFKELERIKNEFIAAASHDLKNPIASMLLSSNLVKRIGPLSPQQTKILERIEYQATQMHQLVTNILDLSRVNLQVGLKQQSVELAPMLQEIYDEFLSQADEKKLSLDLNLTADTELLQIQGERLRLQQVFRNLVNNAVKYTPENGRITISTDVQDDQVRIHVQDDGMGIPADDLPHVFDSFYRVSNEATKTIEGTGFGLAIVKSIVEQHNGQIEVASSVGKGTCFTVQFPLYVHAEISTSDMAFAI